MKQETRLKIAEALFAAAKRIVSLLKEEQNP